MKILLIHQTSNQDTLLDFFNTLGGNKEINELKVLSPSSGYDSFRKRTRFNKTVKKDNYELILGEVFFKDKKIVNPYSKGLIKLLKEFKPDVVHVMYEAMSTIVLQVALYRKIFGFNYKIFFYGFENIYPSKLSDFSFSKQLAIRFIRKNLDGGGYANTEGIQRLKTLGFDTSNIKRVFRPVEIKVDDCIKKLDDFTVCYVGRVTEEKGIFDFLRKVDRLNSNIKVKIIGKVDDNEKELFFNLIKENNQIEYIPEIEYSILFRTIAQYHVMIVPSKTTKKWKEQFGKVIPEGMWTDNIVIGSSSGAISDVIGDNELIFDENNFEELIEILNKLCTDKEFYNEKLDYIKVRRKEYSYEKISSQYIDIFKDK
ncbi:glycosyltransferase [bacterium]|nr:glycosyltransferase [bacterium]